MFSMCRRSAPSSSSSGNNGTDGKQIKGGYLLRYKRQLLWYSWVEEWVVLYDDSTMAWYSEEGRKYPSGKVLMKEAPEMLAISNWTSQVPKRPPIPSDCQVSQLMALGTRRKRSKVFWMLAKTEKEVAEWMAAISKTLPPAPQIELMLDKPQLSASNLRHPVVRIRPATNSEIACRHRHGSSKRSAERVSDEIEGEAAIAAVDSKTMSKGTVSYALPWGRGWGWSTLPNGVWNGGLTWSTQNDFITLHALPTVHCTNLIETVAAPAMYHTDVGAGVYDVHGASGAGIDDLGGDDFDYGMDCGDFIF